MKQRQRARLFLLTHNVRQPSLIFTHFHHSFIPQPLTHSFRKLPRGPIILSTSCALKLHIYTGPSITLKCSPGEAYIGVRAVAVVMLKVSTRCTTRLYVPVRRTVTRMQGDAPFTIYMQVRAWVCVAGHTSVACAALVRNRSLSVNATVCFDNM